MRFTQAAQRAWCLSLRSARRRGLAEAPCKQVIDLLGDVAAAAVPDPDERRKLAYLLVWLLVCADERAQQL